MIAKQQIMIIESMTWSVYCRIENKLQNTEIQLQANKVLRFKNKQRLPTSTATGRSVSGETWLWSACQSWTRLGFAPVAPVNYHQFSRLLASLHSHFFLKFDRRFWADTSKNMKKPVSSSNVLSLKFISGLAHLASIQLCAQTVLSLEVFCCP